jgi:3,4-dihydroxy 2-butanone 4-phosphate synthase/GTP cyclohydrolase II
VGAAAISDAISALRAGSRILVAGGPAKGEVVADGTVVTAERDRPWFAVRTLGFRTVGPAARRPGASIADPSPETIAGELLRLAGVAGGGFGVLAAARTTVSRDAVLHRFADDEGLVLVDYEDLVHHLWLTVPLVEAGAHAPVPTHAGTFEGHVFTSLVDGLEHLALVLGEVTGGSVVTRVHSECLTGDVFGSLRCDCGEQLSLALDQVVSEGSGVVVYVRGHEGRGIGLAEKLRAYRLQDAGRDTVEANLELGHGVDERHYGVAAQVLSLLGIGSVVLLTNNPAKISGLVDLGIDVVGRLPLWSEPTLDNGRYLETKWSHLGHIGPELG